MHKKIPNRRDIHVVYKFSWGEAQTSPHFVPTTTPFVQKRMDKLVSDEDVSTAPFTNDQLSPKTGILYNSLT